MNVSLDSGIYSQFAFGTALIKELNFNEVAKHIHSVSHQIHICCSPWSMILVILKKRQFGAY